MSFLAVKTHWGELTFSASVVAETAKRMTLEVKGVDAMAGRFSPGISSVIAMEDAEGVHISDGKEGIVVDIYVVMRHGIRIPEAALTIQKKIKEGMLRVFGISVEAVNVNIQNIVFKNKE